MQRGFDGIAHVLASMVALTFRLGSVASGVGPGAGLLFSTVTAGAGHGS
jgi:hypothetical protein